MEKIEAMRHEYGAMVPPQVKDKLAAHEVDYFKAYGDLLNNYQRTVDMDLTSDLQPPKQLMVEVLVLEDQGEIMTERGPIILHKDDVCLLRRVDVEHLIRQGVLKETRSKV